MLGPVARGYVEGVPANLQRGEWGGVLLAVPAAVPKAAAGKADAEEESVSSGDQEDPNLRGGGARYNAGRWNGGEGWGKEADADYKRWGRLLCWQPEAGESVGWPVVAHSVGDVTGEEHGLFQVEWRSVAGGTSPFMFDVGGLAEGLVPGTSYGRASRLLDGELSADSRAYRLTVGRRRRVWSCWFISAKKWKAFCRAITGNTAGSEEVWAWNARKLCARLVDAGGSKSGIKWTWLRDQLCEHRPSVVFVMEVEASLRELRGLTRFFTELGYRHEFAVGAFIRRTEGRPVFCNCIVGAVRKEFGAIVSRRRLTERCLELGVQPVGLRIVRRWVCTHGLHSVVDVDTGGEVGVGIGEQRKLPLR